MSRDSGCFLEAGQNKCRPMLPNLLANVFNLSSRVQPRNIRTAQFRFPVFGTAANYWTLYSRRSVKFHAAPRQFQWSRWINEIINYKAGRGETQRRGDNVGKSRSHRDFFSMEFSSVRDTSRELNFITAMSRAKDRRYISSLHAYVRTYHANV